MNSAFGRFAAVSRSERDGEEKQASFALIWRHLFALLKIFVAQFGIRMQSSRRQAKHLSASSSFGSLLANSGLLGS